MYFGQERVAICTAVLGLEALVPIKGGSRNMQHIFFSTRSHVGDWEQESVLPASQILPLYTADFDCILDCAKQRDNYIKYAVQMVK